MTTLDETIKHHEEVAEKKEKEAYEHVAWIGDYDNLYYKSCRECAFEHRQLAAWLTVLKEILDSGNCNDCRNGQCEWMPKLGQLIRYNCPHYVGITDKEVKADENR